MVMRMTVLIVLMLFMLKPVVALDGQDADANYWSYLAMRMLLMLRTVRMTLMLTTLH